MGANIQLSDINDVIRRIREQGERDAEQWARSARDQAEQWVKGAESTRLALLLLSSAGIEPTHIFDTSLRIALGFFPSTQKGNRALADAVRRLREALGRGDGTLWCASADAARHGTPSLLISIPVEIPCVCS